MFLTYPLKYRTTDITNFNISVNNTTLTVLYLYLFDWSCDAVTKIPNQKKRE